MDHEKALDKIKKLLRLAASDNPHEAAAAMRQARALMEKYRLEESDIQLSEVYECAARSGSKMVPPQWEANLAGAVTKAYACNILFMAGIGEWRFIGELAELASYTMTLLLRQIRQSRRDFISTQLKRCKTATKTKRADVFCKAWVSAVRQQVMAFAGNDEPSPAAAAYMLKHHAETEKLDCRERNASKGNGVRAMTDAMHGIVAASDVRLNHGLNGQDQLALN
ncbi:hypothetical protein BLL42_11450 [Pseudomonas frederiksbergensis]|uniref:Uncharacterized protein n=1 Tax=Pseudomonas frederiksbergensis TaxID=104087 RepID=A0A1J0EKB8_9PSED|nr:DUF2786 domain-containing protein [Pseudomonas frederiksbergensis]APC16312.1 hypothetical protein BLL42_11450 [Pseudomonas frederiksbergensis]